MKLDAEAGYRLTDCRELKVSRDHSVKSSYCASIIFNYLKDTREAEKKNMVDELDCMPEYYISEIRCSALCNLFQDANNE